MRHVLVLDSGTSCRSTALSAWPFQAPKQARLDDGESVSTLFRALPCSVRSLFLLPLMAHHRARKKENEVRDE